MCAKAFSPVVFQCREKIGRRFERWSGTVTNLINHGSHYEVSVNSRSGFVFIIGSYAYGCFISVPAFNVGSDLADYGDYFWNNERLASIMNKVDAATIAEALRTLRDNDFI